MMVLIFIITLWILVLVHEAGHYAMARFFRVAIAEFSIGFGPALWTHTRSSTHTKFKIAAILLGGYVKFYEQEPPPTAGRLYQDLGLGQKILILLAGPVANLIFAFVMLLWLLKLSSYSFLPWIGAVNLAATEQGFAPGQKIVAVNHQVVRSWEDIHDFIGTGFAKTVITVEDAGHQRKTIILDPKASLSPLVPKLPAVIASIRPNSPAARAGLQLGDRLLVVNRQVIQSFPEFSQYLQAHPQQDLHLVVQRQQQTMRLLVPARAIKAFGMLGIYTFPFGHYPQWFFHHQHSWSEALGKAGRYFWQLCWLQIKIWGHLPHEIQHLSSPIGIAKTANETWSLGIKPFLQFLVWLSIGLAVVNLLPIPILDGGQCVLLLLNYWFPKFWHPARQQYLIIWSIFFLLVLFGVGLFNDLSF